MEIVDLQDSDNHEERRREQSDKQVLRLVFLQADILLQVLVNMEVVPIFREIVELISVDENQHDHGVTNDCDPERIHHLPPHCPGYLQEEL